MQGAAARGCRMGTRAVRGSAAVPPAPTAAGHPCWTGASLPPPVDVAPPTVPTHTPRLNPTPSPSVQVVDPFRIHL